MILTPYAKEITSIYTEYFIANYDFNDENDLSLIAESIWHMLGKEVSIDDIKEVLKNTDNRREHG